MIIPLSTDTGRPSPINPTLVISHFISRPENNVFTGLEITDDRFFIAIPNLRSGNVATLTAISRHTPRGSNPVLQVYPSWDFQETSRPNNCTGLVSVYRMRKDSCNRLWVSIQKNSLFSLNKSLL